MNIHKLNKFIVWLFLGILFSISAAATNSTLLSGAVLDCSVGKYIICDDFDDASLDAAKWRNSATACSEAGGVVGCPNAGGSSSGYTFKMADAYDLLNNTVTWCLELKEKKSVTNGVTYQYIADDAEHSGGAISHYWDGSAKYQAVANGADYVTINNYVANTFITNRICHIGGEVLTTTTYNDSTHYFVINKTQSIMEASNRWGFLSFTAGIHMLDYAMAWSGSPSDAPYLLPTAITNSSFNVTNYPDLIGMDGKGWNNGTYVNVSSNLLTFTFTTSSAANASCSVHNLNYTAMIAKNSNYKLATTLATAHSATLFDNLSAYNSSLCVYCAYSDGTLYAQSGCLKAMFSDITPPTINKTGFAPDPLSFFKLMNNNMFFHYNVTDQSAITSSIISHKVNRTWDNYAVCTGGLCRIFVNNNSNFTSSGTNRTFSASETLILPATYNIDEIYMENTTHSSVLATLLKMRIYNILPNVTQGIFEFMANTTSASSLNIYYCNSTYTTGVIQTSPYCGSFATVLSTQPYNHSHSSYSKHKKVSFNIGNGYISGVKATNISYFVMQSNNNWNFFYISNNTGTLETSINNGNTYSALSGTFDAHIHQDDIVTLYDFVCAVDIWGNSRCSNTSSALLYYDVTPPSSPSIFSPSAQGYKANISINYTNATVSSASQVIVYYLISLYDDTQTFISVIANNSLSGSYIFDIENITDDNYIIGVEAFTNWTGMSANDLSEEFFIDRTAPTCTGLNDTGFYYGMNTTIFADLADPFGLAWYAFYFNGTLINNLTTSSTSINARNSFLISVPINDSVTYGYNSSDRVGNLGSCSRIEKSSAITAITPFFVFAECPNTTQKLLIFIIFCVFGLIIGGVGFAYYSGLTTIFGSLLLFFASISLLFCHLIMGIIIMIFFLVMMLYGAMMCMEGKL